MAMDVEGYFGDELMRPEAKGEVIKRLQAAKVPPDTRWRMYARWAKIVGVTVEDPDLVRLLDQGIEGVR